jgi:hypothetical protein
MSTDLRKLCQTAAHVLTVHCLCSTVALLLFVFFGPREGMEAMVIIIPWYIAGLMDCRLKPLLSMTSYHRRAQMVT